MLPRRVQYTLKKIYTIYWKQLFFVAKFNIKYVATILVHSKIQSETPWTRTDRLLVKSLIPITLSCRVAKSVEFSVEIPILGFSTRKLWYSNQSLNFTQVFHPWMYRIAHFFNYDHHSILPNLFVLCAVYILYLDGANCCIILFVCFVYMKYFSFIQWVLYFLHTNIDLKICVHVF